MWVKRFDLKRLVLFSFLFRVTVWCCFCGFHSEVEPISRGVAAGTAPNSYTQTHTLNTHTHAHTGFSQNPLCGSKQRWRQLVATPSPKLKNKHLFYSQQFTIWSTLHCCTLNVRSGTDHILQLTLNLNTMWWFEWAVGTWNAAGTEIFFFIFGHLSPQQREGQWLRWSSFKRCQVAT